MLTRPPAPTLASTMFGHGLPRRHVHARRERPLLAGGPHREVAADRRLGGGDVQRDGLAVVGHAAAPGRPAARSPGPGRSDRRSRPCRRGCRAGGPGRAPRARRRCSGSNQPTTSPTRCTAPELLYRSIDPPTPDTCDHQVRDRRARHRVEVRRERTHLAAGRHRHVRGGRGRVDRRQVDRDGDRVERDAVLARDREPPGLAGAERGASATGAVASVEHALRRGRHEATRFGRRQHDHRDVAAGRAGRAVEQAEVLEGAAEDGAATAAQPAVEHRADDPCGSRRTPGSRSHWPRPASDGPWP
jgi:hypothetical protein